MGEEMGIRDSRRPGVVELGEVVVLVDLARLDGGDVGLLFLLVLFVLVVALRVRDQEAFVRHGLGRLLDHHGLGLGVLLVHCEQGAVAVILRFHLAPVSHTHLTPPTKA